MTMKLINNSRSPNNERSMAIDDFIIRIHLESIIFIESIHLEKHVPRLAIRRTGAQRLASRSPSSS